MDSKFFVPFETAKLLKEKEYPQEIDTIHFDGRIAHRILSTEQMAILCIVAAPTYHEVVDWLEGKGIIIEAFNVYRLETSRIEWKGVVTDVENDCRHGGWGLTREEALNAAILKALEMI